MRRQARRDVYFLISAALLCCFVWSCAKVSPQSAGSGRRTAAWFLDKFGEVQTEGLDLMIARIQGRLRLAAASTGQRPEFEIHIFHYEEPLAFSAAEGQILIADSLLLKLETEDEVAAVIAHELSHTLLGHIDPTAAERGAPVLDLSEEKELAADRNSILLLSRAGYDPLASITALRALYRSSEFARPDAALQEKREQALDAELANTPAVSALRPRLRSQLFSRVKSEITEATSQMESTTEMR